MPICCVLCMKQWHCIKYYKVSLIHIYCSKYLMSDISIEQTVMGSRCTKTCLSRIGFISHQCAAPYEDFLLTESSFTKQSYDELVVVVKEQHINKCYYNRMTDIIPFYNWEKSLLNFKYLIDTRRSTIPYFSFICTNESIYLS